MVCANFAHTTSFWRSLFNGFAAKNAKIAKKWKTSDYAHNLSRKAVAFGIILTVRNGNASDLIASRREPPQ